VPLLLLPDFAIHPAMRPEYLKPVRHLTTLNSPHFSGANEQFKPQFVKQQAH
jgi:hypothetical protein